MLPQQTITEAVNGAYQQLAGIMQQVTAMPMNTVADAKAIKQYIALAQREMRQMRSQAVQLRTAIHSIGVHHRATVQPGLLTSLFGSKGDKRHVRSVKRDVSTHQEHQQRAMVDGLVLKIDQEIQGLEDWKLRIDYWLVGAKR